MKVFFKAVLLATALLALSATAASAGDYREIEASHELAKGQAMRIDFHSGDLRIEPATGRKVTVELSLECKWRRDDCEETLEEIEVDWISSDRRLRMEVDGLDSWRFTRIEVEAVVKVPSDARLTVDMGAGRLEIEEHANDVRVDLGAGEFRLFMAEAAVESVSIDVGVGEARLRGRDTYVSGRRSMLIGSEVMWSDGPGKALVDIEVGAGEATVWLE